MLAELIRPSQSPLRFASCITAATTSALMLSQHDLKKAPMKPSGPGALTEGKENTASLISASSNGSSRDDRSWRCIPMFSHTMDLVRRAGVPRLAWKCSRRARSLSCLVIASPEVVVIV